MPKLRDTVNQIAAFSRKFAKVKQILKEQNAAVADEKEIINQTNKAVVHI
jgi:hypothetical protein